MVRLRVKKGEILFRLEAGARDFSLLPNVKTGCGAHQASYSVALMPFLWEQRGKSLKLTMMPSWSAHGQHYIGPVMCRIPSRRMRWAGHVTHVWEWRSAYRVLIRKPEGKTTWKAET
jgi:hypothetical protein